MGGVYPWRLPVAVIALLSESLFHMIYYIFCANRIYSSVHPQKGTAMYHSFKGLLSGAILTGLLLLASEPVEASGYEIVMPTEITNLHADVTHIMVTANGSSGAPGQPAMQSAFGVGFAAVDSDRSVNESISISMDSEGGRNVFSTLIMYISINPCHTSPIMVDSDGNPLAPPIALFFANMPLDESTMQPLPGGNCHPANGAEPYSMIDGWVNNVTLQLPVSDLSP